MAGFEDLIDESMPYLWRDGREATVGTTWRWGYVVRDADGNLIDFTGITGDMSIRTPSGTEIFAPTVTFPAAGEILCTATPAATAALTPRDRCLSELTLTRTSDGAKVLAFGAGDSVFSLKKKVDP